MLEIRQTTEFERDLKRMKLAGKDLRELKAAVQLLAQGETNLASEERRAFGKAYRDHPLHGEWGGVRDCHIEGDWLLLYKIEDNALKLVRTGTHEDLFRSWRAKKDDAG